MERPARNRDAGRTGDSGAGASAAAGTVGDSTTPQTCFGLEETGDDDFCPSEEKEASSAGTDSPVSIAKAPPGGDIDAEPSPEPAEGDA